MKFISLFAGIGGLDLGLERAGWRSSEGIDLGYPATAGAGGLLMFISEWPLTEEQAKRTRYRQWAGEPKGSAWVRGFCAAGVPDRGISPLSHQCGRPSGRGPDRLYCKTHARQIENYLGRTALAGDQ